MAAEDWVDELFFDADGEESDVEINKNCGQQRRRKNYRHLDSPRKLRRWFSRKKYNKKSRSQLDDLLEGISIHHVQII